MHQTESERPRHTEQQPSTPLNASEMESLLGDWGLLMVPLGWCIFRVGVAADGADLAVRWGIMCERQVVDNALPNVVRDRRHA